MFTTEVQQALRALSALAAADGPLVLDTLAREAQAPAPALAKTLSRLARLGLVIGQRGPGGGYRLGRAAEEIHLADIVVPMQGTAFARTCLFGRPHCSNEAPCPLHATWEEVRSGLLDMIEKETLASMLAKPVPGLGHGASPGSRSTRPRAAATRRRAS